MELTAELGHQVNYAYLISVLEYVVSAAALDAFPLVKAVEEIGGDTFSCPRRSRVPRRWLL